MPTLTDPAGAPVDTSPLDKDAVDAQFALAMNDDSPDDQAPPKRAPRPAASEDAPRPRRGRPPKDDKARADAKAATPVKDDYTGDAQQFVGGIWVVTASIPLTSPYAVVVESNADPLVKSLAEGAKHNATIRAFVTSGESSWILGLASVTVTMGMQGFQIMRDPVLRAECAAATKKSLKEALGAKGLQPHQDDPQPDPQGEKETVDAV